MAGEGKITVKDIADSKAFKVGSELANSLKPADDAVKKINESLKKLSGVIKSVALSQGQLDKEYKKAGSNTKFIALRKREEELLVKSEKTKQAIIVTEERLQKQISQRFRTEKAAIDLQKTKLALEKAEEAAKKRKTKLTAEERLELQQLNRRSKEAAVLSSSLSTEYEKQALKLTQLRRKYKDVALTEGEASKKAKELRSQIQKLDASLKRVDANVGQFQRSVGNYGKAMSSARNAARSLASAMGLVGGAFLFVQVMRDSVKVLRDFEKQNATLSGILQVSKEEMKGLADDAQRLGETTVKTASQVTELQIAYARLGFNQEQIIALTESTIAGSIAMNSELDSTATLVGAVVNTFDNLSETDAPKIIDILSLSTAKSALNFQKLETGIPIVAGAANAAGIPFTKLVALMGKLSDSGIDVSTSSTSLRNIFIESAAKGLNYGQIIEKIKGSQDKLTASNDAFGKRAAVSATVLAQNIDATKELDEALQGAAGTAQSMADKELDTLDGSLKLLRSAWEGVILESGESLGLTESLKNGVKFLAENLKTLVSGLVLAVKIWGLYKIAVASSRLQTFLVSKQFALTRLSALSTSKGVSVATLSFQRFNAVLKKNALFLIIGGAVLLYQALQKLNSELSTSEKTQRNLNEATKVAAKSVAKEKSELDTLIKTAKNENLSKSQRLKAIKELNKISPEYLGGITLENSNTIDTTTAIDNYIKSLDKKALAQALFNKKAELYQKLIDTESSSLEENITWYEELGNAIISGNSLYGAASKNSITAIKNKQNETQSIKDEITALDLLIKKKSEDGKIDTSSGGGGGGVSSPETDKDRKAREKKAEQLKKELFELNKFRLEQEIKAQDEILKAEESNGIDRLRAIQVREAIEIELAELTEQNLLSKKDLSANARILIEEQTAAKLVDIYKNTNEAIDKLKEDTIANAPETIDEEEGGVEGDPDDDIEILKQGIKEYAELLGLDGQSSLDEFVKLHGTKFEAVREYYDKLDERAKQSSEARKQLEGELKDASVEFVNTLFDRKVSAIDDEIGASDEKYTALYEAAEGDKDQQDRIRQEQEKKRKELEKKKRAEQRKQAIFNKAISVAEIIGNTASYIIKLGGQLGIAAPPFQIAAGIFGALQVATALATPIPKYAKGIASKPTDGIALVGEERSEVITEPNKEPYIVSKPTFLDLPKRTRVTKSVEEYKKLMRASNMASLNINAQRVEKYHEAKNSFETMQLRELLKTNNSLLSETKDLKRITQRKNLSVNIKQTDFNHEVFRIKNTDWEA